MSNFTTTVLWSADSVQANNTSIQLNDSIDNYDEVIYYGSGTRSFCPCVVTPYPVISGQLNLGGPFFVGKWGSSDTWLLCNGTQCFLSGNSGYVASSYYFGKSDGSTAWGASLVNNRANDVRPYMIVGVKYENDKNRKQIWSATQENHYNTNIELDEPVTHYEQIEVYSSGFENGGVGCRHAGKNIYNTQNKKMNAGAWAYTPWKYAERHNLLIGNEMLLSGNSGHIGSGFFFGMGNQTTAYAAGRWDSYVPSALQPYKIIGVNHKPILKVHLTNGAHGTISASTNSGCEYDYANLTATPDEGWYFAGYNVDGATLTGNSFMFENSDVTVEGTWTDQGFPITYESDEHVSITGDNIYIPGSTGITLQTGYDTYYRISGYEVTGGSVENGVLIPTGPCTIKAVAKPNAFTATGGWEKGSDVTATVSNGRTTAYIPTKYALHVAHTGDIPASWYSTSNRWKPTNPINYQIRLMPKMTFSARDPNFASNRASVFKAITLAGSTTVNSWTFNSKPTASQYTKQYTADFTNSTVNVNYGISGSMDPGYYSRVRYISTATTGTWSATGYAP